MGPKAGMAGRYLASVWLAIRFALELWWASKTRVFHSQQRQKERLSALYTRQAVEFREYAMAMGGLIVKLGQVLSVRVDILPKEYIEELSHLQDCLPCVPTPLVIDLIEEELGKPLNQVFASFEATATAAASLGQVHRGRLLTGEDVAIKVLRPGIDALVAVDLRALRLIVGLLARFTIVGDWLDASAFCAEFESTFRDELDYLKEAANAERFQVNFLMNPHVDIPKIFWEHTTRRVLVMEYMDGVKIDDVAALGALGVDRANVACALADIYLQMFLTDGFFHADPHPGNVFVRRDGVIQLIDFGMVGAIDQEMRDGLTALIWAGIRQDASGIVSAVRRLGFVRPEADTRLLKAALVPLIDSVMGGAGEYLAGSGFMDAVMAGSGVIDAALLDRMRELILTQPIHLPDNIAFLGKTLITVFTDVYRLDPHFDLVGTTGRHLREAGLGSMSKTLSSLAEDGLFLLRSLPDTARRLVRLAERVDDGEVDLVTPAQMKTYEQAMHKQTTRFLQGLAAATGLIVGAILLRRR